jgi:hypothetical protein
MPGGGIAVIQAEGESPRVVALGQMIGAYRLASVKEESVVVSTRGWDISLALEEGKASAVAQSDERPGPGNRQGAMRNQNLQQQIEALRARLGSDAQIQVEGGRVFIVRPDGTRQEVQLPGLMRGARGATIPPEHQTGQGVGEGPGGGGK